MEEHMFKIEDMEKFFDMACESVCRKYGITPTAFRILMFLSHNPEHNTAKDICEYACIKNSIASMTIDKLTRGGYLVKTNDMRDRRIQRLTLTSMTDEIITDGEELKDWVREVAFSDFTQEEREQFLDMLCRIQRSLWNTISEYRKAAKQSEHAGRGKEKEHAKV